MKVVDNRRYNRCSYECVQRGEMFIYEDGYYIRTDNGATSVNLTSGATVCFDDSDDVLIVSGTLMISDYRGE